MAIRKRKYTSLSGLFGVTREVSVQQILNRRINHKKFGWIGITVTDKLEQDIIEKVADLLGGRGNTKQKVISHLTYHTPQHWALARITINKHGKAYSLDYTAGQDYTWEIKCLRDYLRK